MNKKLFVDGQQAGEMFGISPGTLANLRSRREGPKFYKVGRRALYNVAELEEWVTRKPMLTRDSLPE